MTYFFYDLETSGLDFKQDRIMQFAGQRTDDNFKKIGPPVNLLIKLTPDVLPSPEAILLTGITPQATLKKGLSEAQFLTFFHDNIVTPRTIYLGYNSIRFDDHFMRFLHYRNFYDPYQWQRFEQSSRWDVINVVRMTRALRPEGIAWPVDNDQLANNSLVEIAKLNHLSHERAHDALSDVQATISLACLIKEKQPKLFNFLLSIRNREKVKSLVLGNQPLVYTSSSYPAKFIATTVVSALGPLPSNDEALIYDLRYDPSKFQDLSPEELFRLWQKDSSEDNRETWPVKVLRFNSCPALAPVGVIDDASQSRLRLDMTKINHNFMSLQRLPDLAKNLLKAFEMMERYWQAEFVSDQSFVDGLLYDGFFDDHDRLMSDSICRASPSDLAKFQDQLHDQRLRALLPLYKARNYEADLTAKERQTWRAYRQSRLLSGGHKSRFFLFQKRISQLEQETSDQASLKILKALRLYSNSLCLNKKSAA